MPTAIGPALREARLRQKVDIREVERHTKIRAKYLRALENEDWERLPEGAYTRGFLRTYANFLSLDGEVLVDEYRRRHDADGGGVSAFGEPVLSQRRRTAWIGLPGPRAPQGTGAWVVAGVLGVLGVLLVLGLTSSGGGHHRHRRHHAQGSRAAAPTKQAHKAPSKSANAKPNARRVSIELVPKADVWVCLVSDSARKVISGVTLPANRTAGPFTSKRFLVTFGNGSVGMRVNGKAASVPSSPNPLGFEVTPQHVRPLAPARRPTCA